MPKTVKKFKHNGTALECNVCGVSTETHRVTLRKRIVGDRKVYVCDICIGRGR